MRFFKGLMCMTCLVLWVVFLLLIYSYAGWYAGLLYLVGSLCNAGFCLLMDDEEDDDGDTVSRKETE